MQTALHITALVKQLFCEAVGGKIVATEFYKKERAVYLFIRHQKSRLALGFVYHPAGWGTFLVPASKIQIQTREKPWPVFKLEGSTVHSVRQIGLDRIFEMTIDRKGSEISLIFEAIGPNGNVWLLDCDGRKQATLRKRDFTANDPYQPPPASDRLSPLLSDTGSLEPLQRTLIETGNLSITTFIEKQVAGFNRTMAREAIARADESRGHSANADMSPMNSLTGQIARMAEQFLASSAAYLYPTYTGIEVYPFKLTTEETTPEKYKNLSLAIQAMVTRRQSQTVQIDRKKLLRDAVKRKLRSLSRRLSAIESDLKTVSDFEHFKKLGELLQINFDQVKTGMPQIVVDDVYTDPQKKLTIPLEPKLTPRQNVDSYFKKHRKGRQGREILRRRLEITRTEIASLNTIAQALESDFESASKQYEQDLEALLPNNRTSGGEQVRLPYREHLLSTGARIYVGRDGSDNDRTTFDFARPYELWFHAQQCPGSHVVLKFPNKSFEPTKAEIEETAAVAAWHSKARNDSLVPIIYTQRKYVRKPRKAKPGLVTVEREKSIMVTPRKPENSPIT